MAAIRIAVDIGGTFTDLQILNEETGAADAHKVPTTPADPSEGLIAGILEASERLGFALGDIRAIMHGTTIATNAVLERKLPAGALLMTEGFTDVLEIGRHFRSLVYANKAEERALLIPRARRYPVAERLRADGSMERALDPATVRAAARKAAEAGAKAIAICLLHAYANPEHELEAARIVQEELPDAYVSCSHAVSPEIREFERASTTVLNALLMPVVKTYLSKLRGRLSDTGITAPVYLVQSNGGVTTPETAGEQPARLLLSGPAGGARAAEVLSAELGIGNLIAVDMGGTSYDVSIVDNGAIRLVTEGKVDGLPVRLPMIEIRTIGAGGGSIARVDETGRLYVGPESAGATPGPVSYGRGGTQPAVTDANVALGRIDPDFFLGGAMTLDVDGARKALSAKVAQPLGLEDGPAADGIVAIATTHMASAIRLSLFEKGLDPTDFALISFGGAGGLHACDTAAEIGATRVVFPRDPGTLSAWGMLFSDVVHDIARSRLMKAEADNLGEVESLIAEMKADGQEALARDGIPDGARSYPVTLDLRYPGQAYEIGVPFDGDLAATVTAFHDAHARQYAHAERHVTPEIVTLRMAATGRLSKPAARPFEGGSEITVKAKRPVRLAGAIRETAIVDRETLGPGASLAGPAIIEEAHSTLLIPPGWDLTVHPSGVLIAALAAQGDAA
ncbi:hydantoinase/oxoprolinase family protein [Thalassobaculum salexigens]|uniref:hydantoinase/oxoprolinase family protein n=1 Tax=Thalassobaculum salexigens TaxID=455360 RepID=UPI000417B50B|nr:hydantoinase/oxoprolinase family protein [Thalassobaculum salexigens]